MNKNIKLFNKLFIIFVLVFINGCGSTPSRVEQKKRRPLGVLNELEINEISEGDFVQGESEFKGNPDSKIDELEDVEQIESESIGELSKTQLDELGHVSEPLTQAISFCHRGNYLNGVKILKSLFGQYNRIPRYWNAQGICELKRGNKKKAKYYFDYALGIKKYAPALNNLGVIYYHSGDFQNAFLLFKDSLKTSSSSTAKFNLALVLHNFGLYSASNQKLKSIYRKNQSLGKVSSLLALNSLLLNDIEGGKKYLSSTNVKNGELYLKAVAILNYVEGNSGSGLGALNAIKVRTDFQRNQISKLKDAISRGRK